MWNWFKKREAQSERKTIGKARKLVGAFADLLQTGADGHGPLIGDASDLPCSRSELTEAFEVYIEAARIAPSLFPDNAEKVARVMMLHIDDFYDIAPEDREEVHRINEKSELTERALELMAKYRRSGAGTPPG